MLSPRMKESAAAFVADDMDAHQVGGAGFGEGGAGRDDDGIPFGDQAAFARGLDRLADHLVGVVGARDQEEMRCASKHSTAKT